MGRTINDLSPLEIAFLEGFVQGDQARFYAVVARYFEQKSVREVERETGLSKTLIHNLATQFGLVYSEWRARNGSPERHEAKYRAFLRETVEEYMRDMREETAA